MLIVWINIEALIKIFGTQTDFERERERGGRVGGAEGERGCDGEREGEVEALIKISGTQFDRFWEREGGREGWIDFKIQPFEVDVFIKNRENQPCWWSQCQPNFN